MEEEEGGTEKREKGYEIQMGKAAEHIVVADLILQGYNAFLTDPSSQYDVIVDHENVLYRIQVKAATRSMTTSKMLGPMYRFGVRRGCGNNKRYEATGIDFLAFVALDQRKVAYLPIGRCQIPSGKMKILFEFKSRIFSYNNRVYSTGKIRVDVGKYLEDYAEFKL